MRKTSAWLQASPNDERILWFLLAFSIGFTFIFFPANYPIQRESLTSIFDIVFLAVCFSATGLTLFRAAKNRRTDALLCGSLGLASISLGNLYLLLMTLVGREVVTLSVGHYAQMCCYLFFIAALQAEKSLISRFDKIFATAISMTALVFTFFVAWAVMLDDQVIMSWSNALLDVMGITASLSLAFEKKRLPFAWAMAVLFFLDGIDFILPFYVVRLLIASVSPPIYAGLGLIFLTSARRHVQKEPGI